MGDAPDLRESYSLMPPHELHGQRPFQDGYLDEVEGILLSHRQIRSRIDAIAREMYADFSDNSALFVYLCDGSRRFAQELGASIESQELSLRFSPLPLTAKSYHGNTSTGNVVIDESELAVIRDRLHEDRDITDVVLIEDIVDTGLTMTRTARDIAKLREHPLMNVSICTLLDKPERRLDIAQNLPIQYVGFVIPDLFVIGFGLDYNGRFRDMDHIGIPTREAIEKYA